LQHYPTVTFEHKHVYYQSYTQSAFRNTHPESSENLLERQRPGITLRDIRLAIRVEDTFTRHFLASARALPGSPELRPAIERPQSIAEIEKVIQQKNPLQKTDTALKGVWKPSSRRKCYICHIPHDPIFCPERYTKPPRQGTKCIHCLQEGHWNINCPEKELEKGRSRLSVHKKQPKTLSARLNLTSEWPNAPCPQCGGVDHYKSDCPDMGNRKKVAPPLVELY